LPFYRPDKKNLRRKQCSKCKISLLGGFEHELQLINKKNVFLLTLYSSKHRIYFLLR